MTENEAAQAVDTRVDPLGEQAFLKYKQEYNEPDLSPLNIIKDFKVEKQVKLEGMKDRDTTFQLQIYTFPNDDKSKALKPCVCYVTRQTEFSLTFLIHNATLSKLKSAFLACIKGYKPGDIKFLIKDTGLRTEMSLSVNKQPEFDSNDKTIHYPCRLSEDDPKDNDDFKLMNVDLKQTKDDTCCLKVTYALWHTQIALYGSDASTKLWSTLAPLNFVPDPRDSLTLTFKTPKFYESFQYYYKKFILLGASYGDPAQ
jgi:hypothetical protein